MEGVKWVKFDRKQRSDAINEIVKQIVIKWWMEETKVSPNVKDVVCHLISTNNWEACYSFLTRKPSIFVSLTQVLF
jgi:hypothetical protein